MEHNTHISYNEEHRCIYTSNSTDMAIASAIIQSLIHKNSRLLISQESSMSKLKRKLKKWNINFKVCELSPLTILFENGSQIKICDLEEKSYDEDFCRLESLQITGAFVLTTTSEKAVNVLKRRIR